LSALYGRAWGRKRPTFGEPDDGGCCGQAEQQAAQIAHLLAAGYLQCGQKRLLEAIRRVGLVAHQAVRGLPDQRPVIVHN